MIKSQNSFNSLHGKGDWLLSIAFCRYQFLTKKDKPVPIFSGGRYSCLVPAHTRQEKNHALFPGKNLFISFHHGSNFILINKTMILLHNYFQINLCIHCTILLANDLTKFKYFFFWYLSLL